MVLTSHYKTDSILNEIGIDEAGRGPMFGRVYAAAVILPRNENFDFTLMKDSKKFTSAKKLNIVADYIKENCSSYGIAYLENEIIDKLNIRTATHMAMHSAVKSLLNNKLDGEDNLLLVDGIDFKMLTYMDAKTDSIKTIPHICIKDGDNTYCSIAAASILAKYERDMYIEDLCAKNSELNERYGLLKNKGYGTKIHLDGIREYGITRWHRKTFGLCKEYAEDPCYLD
jgi:ribonuclease HII